MHTSRAVIDRPNMSDLLVDRLRAMIVDGRLPPGARVNEVHLAAELAVSRTPLREALNRLVAEGALTSVPRFGYFARPLTLDEFQQIYPIRALLDPEALRLAGIPPAPRLERLAALNARIRAAGEAAKVIDLDNAWHHELLAGCTNQVLIDLIEQFMRRTRRYELALMRERGQVRATARDHDHILAALRAGKLTTACAALRQNMQRGFEPIVTWLRERTPAGPQPSEGVNR
jgi:DNA-binding GntR family transcriptional regulator